MAAKYSLTIGDQIITFPSKKVYDKYKALMDLFEPDSSTGKVPHTNIDPSVLLSNDNPLLRGTPPKVGMGTEVILKQISDEEWDEKYKSQAPGNFKRVTAVDPHGPQLTRNNIPETTSPSTTPPKNWVGPPYTADELQPQNQRYFRAQEAAINPLTGVDCPTCANTTGKQVMVYDCDGNGPYWFPCALFHGATPTNAIIGVPVSCAPVGNPYYLGCAENCWGSQWMPAQISDCLPLYVQCASLKEDPQCITSGPVCATPTQASAIISSPSPCGFISIGSPNTGVDYIDDPINNPTMNVTLKDNAQMDAMLQAAVINTAPHFITGNVLGFQGTCAKWGKYVIGELVATASSEPHGIMVKLELDLANSDVLFHSYYLPVANPSVFQLGNPMGASAVTETKSVWGGNTIWEIELDPATSTYTETPLFNLGQAMGVAGDIVYRPGDNTMFIIVYNSGQSITGIRHYTYNGTLLGEVWSTQNDPIGSYTMFCWGGEIYFLNTNGNMRKIVENPLSTVLVNTPPPLAATGGDGATDPSCCDGVVVMPPTCKIAGQS